MHYRFLVTFDKRKATSAEEARDYVWETLHEEGFCGSGRWGRGMADWFVIGGRWSGELSRATWAKELEKEMSTTEQKKGVQVWGVHYGDPEQQKLQKELESVLQGMWDARAPKPYVGIPVNRDTYQERGYEDDAMILSQELYEGLLKEHEGSSESEHHADLESEDISPAMVGNKWIVVVDYHS